MHQLSMYCTNGRYTDPGSLHRGHRPDGIPACDHTECVGDAALTAQLAVLDVGEMTFFTRLALPGHDRMHWE